MTESGDFITQVEEAFRFLIDKFGFRKAGSSSQAPELGQWLFIAGQPRVIGKLETKPGVPGLPGAPGAPVPPKP